MFVTTIVVGVVAFYVPFTLTRRPFLRDVITFMIATAWANGVLYDGKITVIEAAGFVALYFIYVLVVIIGRRIYQARKSKEAIDPIEAKRANARNEELQDEPSHNPTVFATINRAPSSYGTLDLSTTVNSAPIR